MIEQAISPSFRDCVLSQPENLASAAGSAREALRDADLEPLRRGTLVLTGIGASWHALAPAVRALRAAGRAAFAVPPDELARGRAAEAGDAFVIVSQSGASTEAVAAMRRLEGRLVVAITGEQASPLARGADLRIPLGDYVENEVATLSYTATLQALGLLCDRLLGADRSSEWERVPELVRETLRLCDADADALAGRLAGISTLDAIGGGSSAGSAHETALLAREALHLPAAAAETREYLHGPLEAVGPGFGCLLFGSGREMTLASALAGYGAAVALITEEAAPAPAGVSTLRVPPAIELAGPILEILPVQLLVTHMARILDLPLGALRRTQIDTKVA